MLFFLQLLSIISLINKIKANIGTTFDIQIQCTLTETQDYKVKIFFLFHIS